MPPPLRTSNSEYSSANLYFLRRLSLLYRKRFSHFYNTDTALLSSSLFPFYPFVLCSSLIDGYFSSTNIHSNRFDLRLNILIVRRNWTQTNFSTLTRYYFTYILFHPVSVFSNAVSILLSNSQFVKMRQEQTHTANQSISSIPREAEVIVSGQTALPFGIGARNETKRNRTAPTSIIFRSFVVERIGCGANRSIGGQSWVAQRVNFGPWRAVRREIAVVPRQGIHLSSGRYNWSC